jgi:predicted nucleic acid-binding protein
MTDYFIDTNVLIYASIENHIHKQKALELLKLNNNFYISNQVILEYIAVITDTKKTGGEAINNNIAIQNIDKFLQFINIVDNHKIELIDIKNNLIKYNIDKRRVFDLYIYLTMKKNNIDKLITFNKKDFAIFQDIELI